jgi:predicted dehydrogenase
MPDNLRIGIVGLGFGASAHLPAFHSLPGVDVIAVAGSGTCEKIGTYEKGGIKHLLRPWEAIVQDSGIDAVSVAVPPFAQNDIVRCALSSGKHVLCEKPFGRDVNEAAAMLQMAKDRRVVNAVDFQFRMEPGIHALRREIEKGVIGKITHVDVAWLTEGGTDNSQSWSWRHNAEQGGGVLGAFGSHVIDYLQWMVDNREVTAEDSLEIFGELSNDIPVQIQISNCCRFSPKHHIEISGSLGKLHYTHKKPFTPEMISLQLETSQGLRPIEFKRTSLAEGTDTRLLPFKRLANLFIREIRGEVDRDLPRFKDGYDVQTVMLAVRKSILSGRIINVEREESP